MLKVRLLSIRSSRDSVMFSINDTVFSHEIRRENGKFIAVGDMPDYADNELEKKLLSVAGWKEDMDISLRPLLINKGRAIYPKALNRVIDMLGTISDVEHEIARKEKQLEQVRLLARELQPVNGKLFSKAKSILQDAGFYVYSSGCGGWYTFSSGGNEILYATAEKFLKIPAGKKREYLFSENLFALLAEEEKNLIASIEHIRGDMYGDLWIERINTILDMQEKLTSMRAKLSPTLLAVARKHFVGLE